VDAVIGWALAAGGGSLILAGLVFGFAPVIVAKVLATAFPKSDPRRAEMLAEIYKVPYKNRVTWLFEQSARVVTEAVPARIKSRTRALPATTVIVLARDPRKIEVLDHVLLDVMPTLPKGTRVIRGAISLRIVFRVQLSERMPVVRIVHKAVARATLPAPSFVSEFRVEVRTSGNARDVRLDNLLFRGMS
jgi:hypothetical protein